MLKTYKDHLKKLSKQDMDNFSKRVQLRLQFRVSAQDTKDYVKNLKSLTLVIPDLIDQIQAWSRDPRIPQQEKSLIGYLRTYLHHPMDVIPYHSVGLFGHLEEAYLTGRIFHRIGQYIGGPNQISTSESSASLIREIPNWLDMAKKVIPNEASKMDRMIGELIQNKLDTFNQVIEHQFLYEKEKTTGEKIKSAVNAFMEESKYSQPDQGQYAAA